MPFCCLLNENFLQIMSLDVICTKMLALDCLCDMFTKVMDLANQASKY